MCGLIALTSEWLTCNNGAVQDLKSVITKVGKFLGKALTEKQLDDLANHLHFDNMKKNPNVNLEFLRAIPGMMDPDRSFINKGELAIRIIYP